MNAFDGVVDVHGKFVGQLHVLPRAYIREVPAYECVELVREDLIEHFQVLMEICTRQDVEITKEFTLDVYNTVKRIHNNMDATAAISEAVKTVGPDNEFLLFKVFLDKVADDSVKELKPRWINRLAGVDVWLESHVRTAIIYVRWDDKE